jgi:hypothetical protein
MPTVGPNDSVDNVAKKQRYRIPRKNDSKTDTVTLTREMVEQHVVDMTDGEGGGEEQIEMVAQVCSADDQSLDDLLDE